MLIHLIQFSIQSLQPAANRARVLELVRGAGVKPGAVLVLPELFSTGTLPQDFDRDTAALIAREDRQFLAGLARETNSHIVAGVLGDHEADDMPDHTTSLRNLCIVLNPDGVEISSYQKIHPFSLGGEDKIFAGGVSVVTVPVEGFHVQTAVCYDLRFPELFRAGQREGLGHQGDHPVDLIVVPANWPASRREHWDVLLRARAIENQCYVAGVNCLGTQHGTSYAGGTALISPKGEVLAAGFEAEGVVSVEISADHVRAWRRVFPALRDRKPNSFWT
jgi:predicted amidohydrolase